MLETFRTENREALDNLERAQVRINEATERKRAAEAGIEAARAACEQIRGFTRGEASRIQRESDGQCLVSNCRKLIATF